MKQLLLPAILISLGTACASAPSLAPAVRARPLQVSSQIDHAEGSFTGTGGLKLFEESWRPRGAEPKAVLIVLHGLKDHADRYSQMAEALVEAGYAVHAMDLRGHALSEGERVWVERFDEYVADLDLFVKRVAQKEPGKKLFLFGHSMGGAISTVYAIDRKPALNGLILSAAALKPGKEVSGFLIAMSGVVSAISPRSKLLESQDERFSRDPEVVAGMKSDPLINQGNGPARTGAELLGAMEVINKRGAELNVPLLALHGDADQLTNPEGSSELVKKAGTSDKTLILYPGLVHDLVHEPERAKVIADVRAWLDARAN